MASRPYIVIFAEITGRRFSTMLARIVSVWGGGRSGHDWASLRRTRRVFSEAFFGTPIFPKSNIVLIGRPNELEVFRGDCGERALFLAICCRIFRPPNRGCKCREISRSESPNDDSAAAMAVLQVQLEETVAERNGTWSATLFATWCSNSSVGTQTFMSRARVSIVDNGRSMTIVICERQDQFGEVNETVEWIDLQWSLSADEHTKSRINDICERRRGRWY